MGGISNVSNRLMWKEVALLFLFFVDSMAFLCPKRITMREDVRENHQSVVTIRSTKSNDSKLPDHERDRRTLGVLGAEKDMGLEISESLLPIEQSNWTCPRDANASEQGIFALTGTIDGRLLCAARCAYVISSPYKEAASFIPNSTVRKISWGVNSILVDRTTDGIVVSF